MAAVTRVEIDDAAIAAFERSPELVAMLESSGFVADVVQQMRRLGSRISQEGADSIDFELDESGEFYHVTWGRDHFYMHFWEVGTIELSPIPFMRPVVDQYNRGRRG